MDSVIAPIELLRDPGAWLPIPELEAFLEEMASQLEIAEPENFFRKVGQENYNLKAWGVLDSVLKMLESPNDIFVQPERLLSYFLSPYPKVKVVKLGDKEILFTFDEDVELYPLTVSYLMGAIEGLPLYMGYPLAQMTFVNKQFHLNWDDGQEILFDESEVRKKNFKPEMVESILESLRDENRFTEARQLRVASTSKSETPTKAEKELLITDEAVSALIEERIEERLEDLFRKQDETRGHLGQIKNDFFKLYDYFTRAQQLITLISSSARKASVREAMRRVDWTLVQKQFPEIIEETCASLGTIEQSVARPEAQRGRKVKEKWNLNSVIEEVIEQLDYVPGQVRIEKRWWADSKVSADLRTVQKALRDILHLSVSHCQSGSELRVVTRRTGRKVEIEITHTGQKLDLEELSSLTEGKGLLSETRRLLESQKGRFDFHSGDSSGSTFLIQLPITPVH